MEVTLLLEIDSREELYDWYLENHERVSEFWLRINRSETACPGVIRYSDAVEVALCFGWIDSTLKRIDEGKAVQRFSPRRKGSHWTQLNCARCAELEQQGLMTEAGREAQLK